MLRSNKGYFLLELLLSLSALLMVCLYLLPLLMEVRAQSQQVEIEQTAQSLMFEELQTKLIENKTYTNDTFTQNRIIYNITWKDSVVAGQKEVCVTVEKNSSFPETSVCGVLE